MSGAKTIRLAIASATVLYLLVLALLVREVWPEEETPPRELTLESVSPARGKLGEPLQVILKGSGFDSNTRVSFTLDSGNRRAVVGTFPSWGAVKDVALDGNVLIMVNQARRLMSIDVTEPARPRMLGSLMLPDTPFRIALAGKTAWVVLRSKGLLSVDISDPRNMKVVGRVGHGIMGVDIALVEERAMVASVRNGIHAVDLKDPSRPRLAHTMKTSGDSHTVATDGSFAFFGVHPSGMQVAQLVDGTDLRLVGALSLKGPILGMTLEDKTAFALSAQKILYAIDISDPFRPRLQGSAPLAGGGRKMIVRNGRAYVAVGNTGLQIFDVTDTRRIKLLGTAELPGRAHCIAGGEGTVFLGTAFNGVQIVDEGSVRRNERCQIPVEGAPTEILTEGRRVILAEQGDIRIGDLGAEGIAPRGKITVAGGDISRASLNRNRLYIPLNRGGIAVVDFTRPHLPEQVSTIPTAQKVSNTAVAGNILYAAGEKRELLVYDLADRARPRLLRQIVRPETIKFLALSGNVLYSGEKGRVAAFDITNPREPRERGALLLPWHMRELSDMIQMVVENGRGYIADGRNGLLLLDLRNPAHPRLSGALDVHDYANKIFVRQGRAYLGTAQKGVFLIDAADPENPTVVAHLNTPSEGRSLAVTDDKILKLSPGMLHACPHPAELPLRRLDSSTLAVTVPPPPLPGNYTVRVFNTRSGAELHGALTFTP